MRGPPLTGRPTRPRSTYRVSSGLTHGNAVRVIGAGHRLDRRGRKRLRCIWQERSWIVGHRLSRIDRRVVVGVWTWLRHVDSVLHEPDGRPPERRMWKRPNDPGPPGWATAPRARSVSGSGDTVADLDQNRRTERLDTLLQHVAATAGTVYVFVFGQPGLRQFVGIFGVSRVRLAWSGAWSGR